MTVLDECVEVASEERWKRQGWHVNRAGASVTCVRDGFARVMVSWIGRDEFVLTWEYGAGTGEPAGEWRAELYPRDEIVMQMDMTLNAYVRQIFRETVYKCTCRVYTDNIGKAPRQERKARS